MSRGAVTAMFMAVDACAWSKLRAFYADDCVYERPGFPAIKGLEALIHFYDVVRPIKSGQHELRHVIEETSRVAAAGQFEGVLRSGSPIAIRFMDLYLFEETRDPISPNIFLHTARLTS